MRHFLEILTIPDNIPITGLVVALIVFLYIAFKQALRNDKLLKEDKKEEMYKEMIK
jgi:hypothetical protein